MRLPLVAGNWKMHGSRASVKQLLGEIRSKAAALNHVEIAVFPPFVFIPETAIELAASNIAWGAQNLSDKPEGAFTGEIDASMLRDFHCTYVIVGHSERRAFYGEDNTLVARKFFAAKQMGLLPILCVGETLAQREAGITETVIREQIEAVTALGGNDSFSKAVIAYEPVWAIGTGLTATPEQAQQVHAMIRQTIRKSHQTVAEQLRILYGGSVKPSNAAALFAMPDIDGGLIGGASLNANEFLEIAKSCKS